MSLLAVIVAGLTLFGGIFVWISKKTFSSKVEEVELRLNEMKQLHDETLTKIETVRELNSNLNVATREVQDLHISLNKNRSAFENEVERINQLWNYARFVELKATRPEIIRIFENNVKESIKLISELECWLKGTLPSYRNALVMVTKVFGENVIKYDPDETILEKLSYFTETLKENEDDFWKEAAISLESEDYEDKDPDNFEDPLSEALLEWQSIYMRIEKVHGIIAAQIKMNPDKFIPKT